VLSAIELVSFSVTDPPAAYIGTDPPVLDGEPLEGRDGALLNAHDAAGRLTVNNYIR
jgi:hypothetical protein